MQTAEMDLGVAASRAAGVPQSPSPLRSVDQRVRLAASLGAAFALDSLRQRERAVAVEIFRCLARDTDQEVRRTLAEHIKACPFLPRGLALQLAADVEAVAVLILHASPVLTDDDLIAIVSEGDTGKQQAIAGRETVSERVAGALVDTGKASVVKVLLVNEGATLSDGAYRSVLETFKGDETIQDLLVERPTLPFEVKERLVWMLSDALRERLVRRHGFPAALAEQFTRHSSERTLVQSLATLRSAKEIDAAAVRLAGKNALTPTLLLRALSAGLLEFFGAAMASLAGVPSAKAQAALRKAGTPALLGLYERAGLPVHLQTAFQVVLEIVLERRRSGHTATGPDAEQRIVDDLVRSYRQLNPDSLESVVYQLGRLDATNPEALRL